MTENQNPPQSLDPWLLELLACPLCDDRPPVRLSDDGKRLVCDQCRHAFPIDDGMPTLRPEDAIPLED
jgi:uncharacterized protein YbaR (Trm112 family)